MYPIIYLASQQSTVHDAVPSSTRFISLPFAQWGGSLSRTTFLTFNYQYLNVKKVVRLKLAPHCANGDEMKRMLDGRASCTVDCWLAR